MKKYNTFGKRFIAGLIDELIFFPISLFFSTNFSTNNYFNMVMLFCPIAIWTLYIVILNGKLGHTIGKKIMNLKILDINEQKVIGLKRAFYRDGIWLTASFVGLAYYIFQLTSQIKPVEIVKDDYNEFLSIVSIIWIIIELATMVTNQKKRGLNDFLGNSVVINVKYQKIVP